MDKKETEQRFVAPNIREIEQKIENRNKQNKPITLEEIRDFVNQILDNTENYSRRSATPIIRIAKMFSFSIYKAKLIPSRSGLIEVNGNTQERYGNNKVIFLNKNEADEHLRFVVAHELAHYLFEFLGSEKAQNPSMKFHSAYDKNKHETTEEVVANTFAAEILMPKDLFIKQCIIAEQEGLPQIYIYEYLSRYFEISIDSVKKRIVEVFG